MDKDKKNEDQEKGFVVRDKRFSAKKGEEGNSGIVEEQGEIPTLGEGAQQEGPLPEIDFKSLVLSLSTSALIQLGEIQDPAIQEPAKNLPMAKQTIDLIELLKKKTKGNLTPEEEKFIETLLYDLKMRYVRAAG